MSSDSSKDRMEGKREETVALTLKWGSLKDWNLCWENQRCSDLVDQWSALGISFSAAMQRDTPEQKKIICDLIDEVKGKIYADWDGKFVTKEEAKKYVREYGLKSGVLHVS